MTAKKVFSWFARALVVLYAAQIGVVVFWELAPIEQREVQGVRYEICRGWGFPLGLIPVLGVLPVVGNEPVRLITTDLVSGRRVVNSYDAATDVRQEHPTVWPERR